MIKVRIDVYDDIGDYVQVYDLVELVNEKLNLNLGYDFFYNYRDLDITTKTQLEEMTEKFLNLSIQERDNLIKNM